MHRETLHTVQALRCIAALGVVISHAADLLIPHDAGNAWFWAVPWTGGVDLFFVISGFIMLYLTHDAFGRPGAARAFLARRIVRIVPSYWFFTTLTVIAVLLAGGRLKGTTSHWPQLITSYGFIPWPRNDGKMVPILAQGWTLNYEMLFYALFALALTWRRGPILLSALLALLVASHGLYPDDWFIPRYWTQPIVLEFLGGLWLAKAYLANVRLPPIAVPLGFALAVTIFAFGDSLHLNALDDRAAVGLSALIVCASLILTPQPQHIGYWWRAVGRGGDASYALYLSHYMIINAVILGWIHLQFGSPWLGVLSAVGVSCILAMLFHGLIERPVTRRLHQRLPQVRYRPA